MKKPSEILLSLVSLGGIRGIIIDYRQTGTDTAETFCEILGRGNKKITGKWKTYSPFLDVRVDWSCVARIRDCYVREVEEWRKFEKENAAELAEFQRLKEKFESAVCAGDQS